jgi:hypothetical protein
VSTPTTESKPRFSLTAPPPKIVLLPDAQFFTRVIPMESATTAAEVAAQVELSLEGLAPFPLAQMYHGHFWKEGAKHALVFAAYRKRFTGEQTDEWHDAEIAMPVFSAVLAAKVGPATTVILNAEDSVTAVHWRAADDVPATVITRPLPPEAGDAARAALRDELMRAVGESLKVEEVNAAPVFDADSNEGELAFKAGELETSFTREQLDALDVRDKDDLIARRRARSRDLLLWRIFLGSAAAIAFALLLEVGLVGGKFWQKSRVAVVAQRAPVVAEINRANELATSIEELSTNRLLPFEMIDLVKAKRPDSVVFTRITTLADTLYTLDVWGQAGISSDVLAYQTALNGLPECQQVEVVEQGTISGRTTFRFKVTFKPESVKAGGQS